MDFELWWLLPIPALFFAMGWIAARIDIKHLLRESRALPLSYFRGLNFLLNEQPDKAIESFIEVVKVDPQTIDLHFALGNLFRRQGEIDRAIRMHQNLLDRPDLPADKRQTAVVQLAEVFHLQGCAHGREALFPGLTAARSRFRRWDSCSRSTSRRRIGRKRSRPPSAWRRWPSGRTSRKSLITTASWRRTRCCVRSSTTRGSSSSRRWPNTSSARARRCCWAMSSHSGGTIPPRSRHGSASSRKTLRFWVWSPTVSPTRTGRLATSRRVFGCCAAPRINTRHWTRWPRRSIRS